MKTPLEQMLDLAKSEGAAVKRSWNAGATTDYVAPKKSAARYDEQVRGMAEIVREVAQETEIDKKHIIGRMNAHEVNVARRDAMSKARDAGYQIKDIAAFFDGRSYSTVLRSISKVEAVG